MLLVHEAKYIDMWYCIDEPEYGYNYLTDCLEYTKLWAIIQSQLYSNISKKTKHIHNNIWFLDLL